MRYLPLDAAEREVMLTRIGVPDIDALFADIPADRRIEGLLDMPLAMSEMAVERRLSAMANLSVAAGSVPFFLGAGAYKRHVPATVDHLIQRSEFLTSYTPYQPEISQGTLQVLFEFQTQVANLTGMEVANASMYDGSTACGEAMLMAHRLTGRRKAVISGGLHPQYADVAATLAHMAGDSILRLAPDPNASEDIALRRSTTKRVASSSRARISSAIRATLPRSPLPRARAARLWSLSLPILSLSAPCAPLARWMPISRSAKVRASATR